MSRQAGGDLALAGQGRAAAGMNRVQGYGGREISVWSGWAQRELHRQRQFREDSPSIACRRHAGGTHLQWLEAGGLVGGGIASACAHQGQQAGAAGLGRLEVHGAVRMVDQDAAVREERRGAAHACCRSERRCIGAGGHVEANAATRRGNGRRKRCAGCRC